MYYEEKVINGVLCFRTLPNTPFVEFSKEKLTEKIGELKQKLSMRTDGESIDPDKEFYSNFEKVFHGNKKSAW